LCFVRCLTYRDKKLSVSLCVFRAPLHLDPATISMSASVVKRWAAAFDLCCVVDHEAAPVGLSTLSTNGRRM
jgi:hypothetical protein